MRYDKIYFIDWQLLACYMSIIKIKYISKVYQFTRDITWAIQVTQLSSFFHTARLIEETEWCYEVSFLILSLCTETPAAKGCADVAEVCCMRFEYSCPAIERV